MKVIIASTDKSLDSPVSFAFGRAPYFIVADTKSEEYEVVENKFVAVAQGAGVTASQEVINQKAQAVVAGNFGPNAYNVLQAAGIKIYSISGTMTVKEALQALKDNKLTQVTAPTRGQGMGYHGGREC
jgi:predicted Fe-Mo cluster-binding NifX family protein